MWTKGLDPSRIAVLRGVPYRKVYDHIRTRITYHPELFGQRLMVHNYPTLPPGGLKKSNPHGKNEPPTWLISDRRTGGSPRTPRR